MKVFSIASLSLPDRPDGHKQQLSPEPNLYSFLSRQGKTGKLLTLATLTFVAS
jgi:hypothetical protein